MRIQKDNQKLLFLVPAKTAKGGIVNYFNVLEGRFNLTVEYFVRGARNWPNRDGKIKEIIRAWNDLNAFKIRIKQKDIRLVQTSTSLGSFAVMRDGLFLRVAQKRHIATIAFFRGWDEKFEKVLTGWKLNLFKKFFFKSDAFIVLSKKFERKLRGWGYNGDIYIETTTVDDNSLKSFGSNELQNKLNHIDLESANLLFLARTEEAKGLFDAIEAFIELKKKYPTMKLTIAGDGFAKEKAMQIIDQHQLNESVEFVGFVKGKEKASVFINSHIYLFPSYSEGMPNSVLEAMAFGLPVITTPVGGLTDFFEDGKHGNYVEIKKAHQIVEKTQAIIEDKELYKKISLENFEYARKRFTTTIVINRLEKIYSKYI